MDILDWVLWPGFLLLLYLALRKLMPAARRLEEQGKAREQARHAARLSEGGFVVGTGQRLVPWERVQSLTAFVDWDEADKPVYVLDIDEVTGETYWMEGPVSDWPGVLTSLRRWFPSIRADWQFAATEGENDAGASLLYDRNNRSLDEIEAARQAHETLVSRSIDRRNFRL